MKYLLSIDDTDDLTKETSTGYIACAIVKDLRANYNVKVKRGVSRHQLLLQEGVPYTSHNSTMCIDVEGDITIEKLFEIGKENIFKHMAASSDPGICVCNIDKLEDKNKLIDFGHAAKERILTKKDAHDLADSTPYILAEELGGDGQGIIGAVAGVGLRLSGNDGTFRGKIHLEDDVETISVKEIKDTYNVEDIINLRTKDSLKDDDIVSKEDPAKVFLRKGMRITFACEKKDGTYLLCSRKKALAMGKYCKFFEPDNDSNECISTEKRCENCLYRRFTELGFKCDRKGFEHDLEEEENKREKNEHGKHHRGCSANE